MPTISISDYDALFYCAWTERLKFPGAAEAR